VLLDGGLASLPVAWMVADRVPIRDGRRALPLAFHFCASLVLSSNPR
jgi:hypothetical protein